MATCPDCRSRFPDDGKVVVCPKDGAALVPDDLAEGDDLAPGTMVGEYRVEAKIGEGGFGSVYRGVQPVIGKAVAIKVLARAMSNNAQVVSRFISEARAVNQIGHRNIVDIFAFGVLPDRRHYFVMELLQGRPLDAWLQERGRLDPSEVLPILRGVLRALGAAHAAGLAHRDLKPENVFLVFDEDGGVTPKLIDFGIAKLLGDDTPEHKTRTGTPIGTPYYMSPEQCRGKNVDHRTDLYAIGAMLHQLLTGKRPFTGDSAMDVLYKQMAEAPPRLSEHRQGLPTELEALLLRLMEKSPDRRPASAAETLAAFEAAIGVGPETRASITAPEESGLAPPARTALESAVTMAPSSLAALPTGEVRTGQVPRRTAWLVVAGAVAATAAATGFLLTRSPTDAAPARPPATVAISATGPTLVVSPAPDGPTGSAPNVTPAPSAQPRAPSARPTASASAAAPQAPASGAARPRYDPNEIQF